MNFEEVRQEKVEEIEKILKKYLPAEEGYQKTVLEAMNYSVLAGGKRLRPMLMQETFRMFGGEGHLVEPFMAAMEMIHTYSLVHDDLPCMDNDEYRRGRKTTHAVYGEGMAVLAGDALLNYAFETACKAFELEPADQNVARAFTILAKKAGVNGMIGGQVVDVEMTGKQMSGDQLHFVYENKTGALIEASMMIGAVLAGATEDELKQVEMIASDIGLAFQIQDDLLDILGDSAVLGKPVCSDEENGKVTYVTVHGLEESKKDVAEISRRAVTRLDQLPYKNEFLDELILELINRKK